MSRTGKLHQTDYEALAEFRHQIRRFLRFSEGAARQAGIEPRQHQVLLALRGSRLHDTGATVGYLAEQLQMAHHSAVGLVDRLERRGLVRRERDRRDRRQVLVRVTARGSALLERLSLFHLSELREYEPLLVKALRKVGRAGSEVHRNGR